MEHLSYLLKILSCYFSLQASLEQFPFHHLLNQYRNKICSGINNGRGDFVCLYFFINFITKAFNGNFHTVMRL